MKKFRVAEVFGPTIQGEGRRAGLPCYFIRFAGCDFRCKWCDSPHAVLPEFVSKVPQFSEVEIHQSLRSLPSGPEWVVFSGGNPALFDLMDLTRMLHGDGYRIMVETQGTEYQHYLSFVDDLCVSPKPPSAGNVTTPDMLRVFLDRYYYDLEGSANLAYLKVVVFNRDDYQYAKEIHSTFPNLQMFLSVGNEDPQLPTVANPHPEQTWKDGKELQGVRDMALFNMAELMERVAKDTAFKDVRVLPQLHVLAWGNERGR